MTPHAEFAARGLALHFAVPFLALSALRCAPSGREVAPNLARPFPPANAASVTPHASAPEPDERVRFADVYVTPYYTGPTSAGGAPRRVSVHMDFDTKLASVRPADVLAVRDAILKDSGFVSPMTMFVLSARLYDVGERDEAVFWFYVARERFRMAQTVLGADVLGEAGPACAAFVELIGPIVNGYAFCDFEKQKAAVHRSLEWSARNPYKALLLPSVPAVVQDREAALKRLLEDRQREFDEGDRILSNPQKREEMRAARRESRMDQKYCW